MKIEQKYNGITNVTVITADEGKDLFCKFHQHNEGKEVWLGFVYYDKDSNLLEEPYLLTPDDFEEIDEEVNEEPEA